MLLVVELVVVDMVVVAEVEVWYLHLVVVYLFPQVLSQLLLEVVAQEYLILLEALEPLDLILQLFH